MPKDSRAAFLSCAADRPWILGCLLAAVAFALYLPSLSFDFVWDGRATVLMNPYVHGLGNLADILTLRVMHLDVIDNNRPVFVLTAMLDWALWKGNPAGYHLTNVLLHVSVTLLLFGFACKLMKGVPPWGPFFAALIFAVHPVNCEAVAEISYRKDLLAAAGILAGLHFAALFQPVFSRRNVLLGAACVACLLLAAGAKENGVAGPFVLVCYWLLFRRGEPRTGWIALCAAALLVTGVFMAARFILPPWPSTIFTERPGRLGGSPANTLLIQARIWALYFRQMILPGDLCADYGAYSIRNFPLWLSLAALSAVLGIQVWSARKSRTVCLGAALFWLALLPASNLVPIYRPAADRFLYLPMCGVALMLAAAGSVAKLRNRAMAAVAAAIACALAILTFRQEMVWRDNLTLWKDVTAKNPFSFSASNNLAEAQMLRGDAAGAVTSAQNAIRLSNARQADPFAILAVAWDMQGRTAEADEAFLKAVHLDARYRRPELLVKALVICEQNARLLEVLAQRNGFPPEKQTGPSRP